MAIAEVLQWNDGVRAERLPAVLQDKTANTKTWRSIYGAWIQR